MHSFRSCVHGGFGMTVRLPQTIPHAAIIYLFYVNLASRGVTPSVLEGWTAADELVQVESVMHGNLLFKTDRL
ncbi:hypothetical protein CEXT_169841 [Caerostris extrusa]|uniref:Uncharacterized protein n=1 Tax=Caerostris extrusa TaxID=172846 RepID=A0AAV4UP68_CAEEX|nr:hypothetical protein CEXT_169841 [Caerostris extrusa]